MDSKGKRSVTVRVQESRDPCEWELLSPDGTPIEGWYLISVGRDHSGRYALHVVFDDFECVNAEGQRVGVQLTGVTHQHVETEGRLPSARTHRHRP